MKLMTAELEKRFAKVGSQEEVKDPEIIAKFFDPVGDVPPKKWTLGKDQVHLERRQSDERAQGEAAIHT